MTKPRILIVSRRHQRKNKWVDFVGEYHLDLILEFGGIPVMVPRVPGTMDVLDAYGPMHGLLVVEGEDLALVRHGGPPGLAHLVDDPDFSKDAVEFELIRRCLEEDVPYLGLCRGCQVLNVAKGGTLYTDVMAEQGTELRHISEDDYDGYRHGARFEKGSLLEKWYGKQDLRVNSYHHQGVRDLAPGLEIMARAEDGLVEGFWDPKARFCVGLQFHPERMLDQEPRGARVYEAFLEAARGYAGGSRQ